MQSNAARRVTAARTALILDEPFFGQLALKLRLVEDPTCPTAWTDGVRLGYSPSFVASLSQAELLAVVVHEVLHVTNGHPWRREGRTPLQWNIACDAAINHIITESGFTLPKDCVDIPEHHGKSAEYIYARLPKKYTQSNGEGDGKGNAGIGEVRDAPGNGEAEESGCTQADWQQAVQAAAKMAQAMGKLPGGMERIIGATQNRTDWKSVLLRFVQQISKADYTWRTPNKRYIASGLYLPSLHSESMGPVAIGLDMSGSVDQTTLNVFGGAVEAIASQCRPERIDAIYCDSTIQGMDSYGPDDHIRLTAKGGGGTDFRPVFESLKDLETEPVCLIYLTDGWGTYPDNPPDIPVIWAMTTDYEPPWGEVVRIDE
jgi:predicted metal-dependent peptidase